MQKLFIIAVLLSLTLTSCQETSIQSPTKTIELEVSPTLTNTAIPTLTITPTSTITTTPIPPTETIITRISVNDLSPGLYYVTGNMMGGELNIHQVNGDFSGIFLEDGYILYGLGISNPQYTKMLTTETTEGDFVIFDLDTNQSMLYAFSEDERFSPGYWTNHIWSPDGEMIIVTYSARDSDHGQLGLIRLSEPIIKTLNLELEDIENPTWSPNGKWIAFQARNDPENDTPYSIYVMDADCLGTVSACKEHTRSIFASGGYSYSIPIWSADNQHLAFDCTNVAAEETGLCVGNINNGNLMTISPPEEYTYGADWSPKSNEIAYWCKNNTSQDFPYGLCINNLSTGKIKIITTAPDAFGHVKWSPDGNWIESPAGGEETILIRPDGSDVRYTGLFEFWIEIPKD